MENIFRCVPLQKALTPAFGWTKRIFVQWFELKNWLELSSGLDRDSLHIYAGVGVQLAAALLCRRSVASPVPWLFVAVAALANEYYDYEFVPVALHGNPEVLDEAIRDIWNTLLLPSVLLLIANFWPHWLTARAKSDDELDALDEDSPPL